MPPVSLALPAFAAGEISPRMMGRVDVAQYQQACATLLNWYVVNSGGAITRAGTAFVGEVYDSTAASRLVSFQFSQVQAYILEFANLKMRVIMNGGYVLEAAKNILGITQANPGVVNVAAHGYSNGDHVWHDGIVSMTQFNRRRVTVTVIDADHYSIGIDTTAYGAWSSGGTAARFFTLATSYAAADLPLLKFVQSADTLTITHPGYSPANLTRTSHTAWTLTQPITFAPTQQAPTGLVSDVPGTVAFYAVTAVNDITGEESLIAGPSGANTTTSTLTWTNAAGASTYFVYKSQNGLSGLYGLIGRGGTGAQGFKDATIVPNMSISPPQNKTPFGGFNLWPGCSTYHDGRQWYANSNTQPQTMWASQSAAFNNMSTSTPGQDSDAIVATIASREVNTIRHLISLDQLVVLTSGALWKCWPGSQVDVLTPSNISVKPQIYEGASDVAPFATGETSLLFVTASGKRVRDLQIPYYGNYTSSNLSLQSQHLFETTTITAAAYAKDPNGMAWYVRNDGVLLGFTYLPDSKIYGWSRHTFGGTSTVESVATCVEASESILYLIVNRTIGGVTKRYVERMVSRVFPTVYDAWCVDSGYRVDGWNTVSTQFLQISGATYNAGDTVTLAATGFTPFTNPGSIGTQYILRNAANQSMVSVTITGFTSSSQVTATLDVAPHTSLQNVAITDYALATITMGGLWHLNGQTVTIFADGSVEPTQTVVNGTITLTHPAGRILAGVGFIADLETVDVEEQPTIQGKQKRITEVTLRLENTRGLSSGPTFDRLTEIKERSTENYGWPTSLTTGDEKITIDPLWNSNGRICVRQANPLPAMIAALIPKLVAGE